MEEFSEDHNEFNADFVITEIAHNLINLQTDYSWRQLLYDCSSTAIGGLRRKARPQSFHKFENFEKDLILFSPFSFLVPDGDEFDEQQLPSADRLHRFWGGSRREAIERRRHL